MYNFLRACDLWTNNVVLMRFLLKDAFPEKLAIETAKKGKFVLRWKFTFVNIWLDLFVERAATTKFQLK